MTKLLIPKPTNMNRLFFALDISSTDKEHIAKWRESHVKLDAKPIKKENFHITLAFLGEVNLKQQAHLIESSHNYWQQHFHNNNQCFKLIIQDLDLFRKPQVLYLGFESFPNRLIRLAEFLKQAAQQQGIKQEERPYLPHISIYRKAKIAPLEIALNLTLHCTSFSLYHSQSTANGVTYTPVKTWSLTQD